VFYKLWGKQYVYDHHDLSPDLYRVRFNDGGKGLVFHALVFFERLSCRLADRIIATNESHRAVEIERGGAQAGRITVIRNGSYLGQAEGAQPDPGVRGSANTVIAYAGVIGYQDGVDYLIRALAHLVGGLDRRDFRCLICGTGDALPEVQALVGEFGLESYVRFTGWLARADLVPRLLAADICVAPEPSNPYNDRSTMIKLMEYMALGKPTVAFDLPEHRVTAGEAAVYATPNDELDFARQIARLMDAPDLRARLGRVGKMRIETGLAWPYQAKKLLAAYASLRG
jgi:glycosyltransferase involved in cell wall biosynthesis